MATHQSGDNADKLDDATAKAIEALEKRIAELEAERAAAVQAAKAADERVAAFEAEREAAAAAKAPKGGTITANAKGDAW